VALWVLVFLDIFYKCPEEGGAGTGPARQCFMYCVS